MRRTFLVLALLALALPSQVSASTRTPDCANGLDDDGDALTDRLDPGCESESDYFEGPLTRDFATNYATFRVSIYLSDGTLRAQRAIGVSCRREGIAYRCSFRSRRRFAYRGAIRVYLVHFGADQYGGPGDVEADRLLSYRGTCGKLRYGVPYAVKTRNVRCETVRRYIFNWFARGKPMPSGYRCRLVSTTFGGGKPAYCRKGRRFFSFKFPE